MVLDEKELNDVDLKNLVNESVIAKQMSYSPYSKFKVGASLETVDGVIYRGANIENVSYGGTVCAERTAILKAVSSGHKKFKRIVITTEVSPPSPPCALCLQTMVEFCDDDFEVFLAQNDKVLEKYKLSELIPHPFRSF